MNRVWLLRAVGLLAFATAACDGDVDLGGAKGGYGSNHGADLTDIPPHADAVEHEAVARVDDLSLVTGFAIVGEELYLSGYGRSQPTLKRCRKSHCRETLGEVPQDGGTLSSIQGYEGRLAGSKQGAYLADLVTYAVPGLTDEQRVIGDLTGVGDPLFHDGFVYWPLSVDGGVYRCALPDCATEPERLGRGQSRVTIAGSFAFWTSLADSNLHRARLDDVEPSQALLADEVLSEAPEEESSQDVYDGWVLAGSEQYLYAAWSGEGPAPGQAPLGVLRWPAEGGARAVVIEEDQPIQSLFLFGGELAYITLDPEFDNNVGTLVSCSVDDCSATRRIIDRVRLNSRSVTADEASLYWLGIEPDRDPDSGTFGYLLEREIRRVPLLPQK